MGSHEKQPPVNILIAFTLSFVGISFVLFFFPNSIFQNLNSYLAANNIPIAFPVPLGNYYAMIYALVPASFSMLTTLLYAKGEGKGEV